MAMKEQLSGFVDAVNDRDVGRLEALLTTDFYAYHPQPGEPDAPAAFVDIAKALIGASSDLRLTIEDVRVDDGTVHGTMKAAGTFDRTLWAVPGDGKRHDVSATVVARAEGDRIALKWEGTGLVPTLRELGIVPMPEAAHLRPAHPARLPEIILRLAFNGGKLQEKDCSHLDLIEVTEPATLVCDQCVASGAEWPALRMCLVCGFVGCCDLSTHKHCKRHFEDTGHPIVRSVEPGESWIWCYADNAFLGSRHLPR